MAKGSVEGKENGRTRSTTGELLLEQAKEKSVRSLYRDSKEG